MKSILNAQCYIIILCSIYTVSTTFNSSVSQSSLQPPFITTQSGIGVTLTSPTGNWSQPFPLELQTVWKNGTVAWTRGPYSSTSGLRANGTLISPGGAILLFTDIYDNVSTTAFLFNRTVVVLSTGDSAETSFATQFSLPAPAALATQQWELFIPGVSYQDAGCLLPSGALAGDPNASNILIREDRLPLPLVSAIFPDSGCAVRLLHVHPNGSTIPNENTSARIVSTELQFGSMGVMNVPHGSVFNRSLVFQFPGSEGDRTYVPYRHAGWANRSHPLEPSFSHSYSLHFSWSDTARGPGGTFYQSARSAWRDAFAAYAPPDPPAPLPSQLYSDCIDALANFGISYYDVAAMPFQAQLPDGTVVDTSSQMGFVGRALPAAALMLYDAVVKRPNASRASQAAAIVDIWASRAITSCGMVRTWFDIDKSGSGNVSWRQEPDSYQGALRIMCDGMKGLVDAVRLVPSARSSSWLSAAVRFGDFLVNTAQAANGSFASSWSWDCLPVTSDTGQTAYVVPFLLALTNVTGDMRYSKSAIRAGAFALTASQDHFVYRGGAVDNPDVPDKESGWLHVQAFLALYDATGNQSWLAPAAQAATYAETFIYAWNVPLPCVQTPPNAYPCTRTSLGASIIATGQSGVDNFMAVAWYDFIRLGSLLGDPHFVSLGSWLYKASSQPMDWDGTLGYALPALLNEAWTTSVRRGAGVFSWLPWLTTNVLEPLVQEQMFRGK